MALVFGKPLTASQRLERNVQIIMSHPAVIATGPVLLLGSKSIADCSTAWTNGVDEGYGEKFVEGLNDPEFRYLILHETGHKMYRHLTAWHHLYEENHRRANIACDIMINDNWLDPIAKQHPDFIKRPPDGGMSGALFGIDATNLDVHEIYALLPDDPKEDSMDDHDWESAKELSPDEAKEFERQINEALRQGALLASKTGTGGDRTVEKLLEPKVDWRTQLAEFLLSYNKGRGVSTWRKFNRKLLPHGMRMPGQIAEEMGEIVIAIDTSGSISQKHIQTFLTEINSIAHLMNPEAVRLMYWDTEVCREEKYEQGDYDDMIESTKPAGGGGTMVECVGHYMDEYAINPEVVVVFTDGHLGGTWGTWRCPVLWCITSKTIKAPIGSTLHIKI